MIIVYFWHRIKNEPKQGKIISNNTLWSYPVLLLLHQLNLEELMRRIKVKRQGRNRKIGLSPIEDFWRSILAFRQAEKFKI